MPQLPNRLHLPRSGPIACISRKFDGFAFCPSIWDTRAAIGTADTPAEPISGLILPPVRTFISLAIRTPPAVPTANAQTPSTTIFSVEAVIKVCPVADAPTQVPSRITRMFIRAFPAVSASLPVLPHSLNRLPSISIPTSGAADGRSRTTTVVTAIGNRIFSL